MRAQELIDRVLFAAAIMFCVVVWFLTLWGVGVIDPQF